MKNNNIEDELDAIRIKLYEATKNMTTEEIVAYTLNQVKAVCEEFGIKPITKTPQLSIMISSENSK
jgi:hypothetical protein